MADRPRFVLSEGSRYGIVLVLLFADVVITIASPPATWGTVLLAVLQGASVLVAISHRAVAGMLRLIVLGVVLLSVAAAALAAGSFERGLTDFLNATVLFALPVIIVARSRRNLYVNIQTVLGAVCVYLVIGLLFASVDSGLSHLTGRPFFVGTSSATRSDYTYFSYITLTTVGYGDLTPGPGSARALAVSEGLMGQLYLVTVIALLVGNIGRPRQSRTGGGATSD